MKKLIGLAIALIMLLSSVTALAVTDDWAFTNLQPGYSTYSDPAMKSDSEQNAYVHVTGGCWTSSDKCWFRGRKSSDDAAATETKWVKSTGSAFTLHYSLLTGVVNVNYKLKAQQDSGCSMHICASGHWTP